MRIGILSSFLYFLCVVNVMSSAQAMNVSEADESTQQLPKKLLWSKLKPKFNPRSYLNDFNKEYGERLGRVAPREGENATHACWRALFEIKKHYIFSNDTDNYLYNYINMAHLLISSEIYPKPYLSAHNSKKKAFQLDLLVTITNTTLEYFQRNLLKKTDVLHKWSLLAQAQLCMYYVHKFPKSKNKKKLLTQAHTSLKKAIKLDTTKMSYVHLAWLIKEFNPEGLSSKEAEEKVNKYFCIAFQKSNNPHHEPTKYTHAPKQQDSLSKSYAKPLYIRELSNDLRIKFLIAPLAPALEEQEGTEQEVEYIRSPSPDEVNNDAFVEGNVVEIPSPHLIDPLEGHDYSNLDLPIRADIYELPFRRKVDNPDGLPQEAYEINGKQYRRQNVSGEAFRCFFNATGLKPKKQVKKLYKNRNNPVVRYMIANEIVSAARTSWQIPYEVQTAVNYALYEAQRGQLDRLEENASERTDQNPEGNQEALRKAGIDGTIILEELRHRALSIKAFNAFIDHHIGGNHMMATLHDVRGNNINDYTSIDAIAYINNIGIKIYQPKGEKELHLAHEFIPQDAREVVFLYHEGVHFQALMPVEDPLGESAIPASPKDGHEPDENQEKDSTQKIAYIVDKDTLTPVDQRFIGEFEEFLDTSGAEITDEFVLLDSEARSLIDEHYGEETDLSIHLQDKFGEEKDHILFQSYHLETESHELYVTNKGKKRKWFGSVQQKPPASLRKEKLSQELKKRYPTVKQPEHRYYEEDYIRKILYCKDYLKMRLKDIAVSKEVKLDSRRVSEILIANGYKQANRLSKEVTEAMLVAYLQFYSELQNETVTQAQIAKSIAKKYNQDQKILIKQYYFVLDRDKKDEDSERVAKKTNTVIRMYKNQESLSEIKEKTGLRNETIIKIIHENVDRREYHQPFDLSIESRKLTKEEKEDLVVKTFQELEKKNPGKSVPILGVVQALKSQKIGYKPVERILKEKGLVQTRIKARHLTVTQKEAIKAEWEKLEPTLKLGERENARKRLARQYGATETQVRSLVNNRTYETDKARQLTKNQKAIVAAYHSLSLEEKLRPSERIAKILPDCNSRYISQILTNEGLYEWNGKSGKAAKNLVALRELEKVSSKKRKRQHAVEAESSESSDFSSSMSDTGGEKHKQQHSSQKKARKD